MTNDIVNKAGDAMDAEFRIRVKHEYTAASDVDFKVAIIEATHTVELTLDSPVVDS